MKTTVSEYDFRNAFREYGREDNFSSDALNMLYEHLTNYEEEVGEEIEFDVIAFCCEFTEYDLEELNQDFDKKFEDMDEASDWLRERTSVCGYNDDIIVIQDF